VAGSLEGEVTESLWCLSAELVVNEPRVGVVLDVVAIDEVLDVKERLVLTIVELVDGHHENVDLLWRIVSVEFFAPQLCVHLRKQTNITLGVNFINILHTAFTYADPKSVKETVKLSIFFELS